MKPEGVDSEAIVKNRFLGLLIWQSIYSAPIFIISNSFILAPFTSNSYHSSFLFSFLSFVFFHLSLLLFSTSLFVITSPQPNPHSSPLELFLGVLKLVFVSGGQAIPVDIRRRFRVSLGFLLLAAASAISGFLGVVCLCWNCASVDGLKPSRIVFGPIGFRGLVVGFCYGVHYIYRRRWVLEFPIIQRPPFFSFKMGIPSALRQAFKLASAGYLVSAILTMFILNDDNPRMRIGNFVSEQLAFYIGTSIVFLCWELSHHLHHVLMTKRFSFAPPIGSAAAETNPSEPLLTVLEESPPRSTLQYLAYLDLCMVSEHNVDTWRRAAFFEETGETYKRVMAACLRPLEQLTLSLSEGLESFSLDKQVSQQPHPSTDSKHPEPFYDFQLCACCARAASSLTVHSHKEDRFGVAQLTGNNAAVISTLLSCLLSVETYMGKKTNLQSPGQILMGPANIRWAALNAGGRDVGPGLTGKRRNCVRHYSKAFSMADVLRTSVYHVVNCFYGEMVSSSRAGLLERDWIVNTKPLYGTRELILQKLSLFLEFQAC